jgi:hypothetical protein
MSGSAQIDFRVRPCCMCTVDVKVLSSTTPHPEAPEMIRLPPGAWAGFVHGNHALEMIVVCSDACLLRLLSR